MGRISRFNLSLILIIAFFSYVEISAQLTLPRVSPHQSINHTIGISTVEINYSSPGVKGREIWGKLVPYGLSKPFPNFGSGNDYPWRAGANENTIIKFSDDVKINGMELSAGEYGLHMIPSENKFTLIFSKNTSSWGSFFYSSKEDVLRVEVIPETAPFEEWLVYGFDNFTRNSSDVYLHWEKLKIPFTVEVDIDKIVVDKFRSDLRSTAGFTAQGWQQAANYCLNNNINIEEAISWIDAALLRNPNFNSKSIKAKLLAKMGKDKESNKIMDAAITVATENELNTYGYQLMNNNQVDRALGIFKMNMDKHPESWNVYDSYAEALSNAGNKKEAENYYKKAHKKAPEAQKKRIETILSKF